MKKILTIALIICLALGLAACGNSDSSSGNTDVSLNALEVWGEIEKASGELPALGDLDDETLQAVYGIDPADLQQYVAKVAMMNVHAEEYFIAEAAEGKIDTVKAGVEKHLADLDELWKQYLPAQYEKVQNAKIIVSGNYILFVVAEDPTIAEDAFNAALGK